MRVKFTFSDFMLGITLPRFGKGWPTQTRHYFREIASRSSIPISYFVRLKLDVHFLLLLLKFLDPLIELIDLIIDFFARIEH